MKKAPEARVKLTNHTIGKGPRVSQKELRNVTLGHAERKRPFCQRRASQANVVNDLGPPSPTLSSSDDQEEADLDLACTETI